MENEMQLTVENELLDRKSVDGRGIISKLFVSTMITAKNAYCIFEKSTKHYNLTFAFLDLAN